MTDEMPMPTLLARSDFDWCPAPVDGGRESEARGRDSLKDVYVLLGDAPSRECPSSFVCSWSRIQIKINGLSQAASGKPQAVAIWSLN